MRNKKFIIIGSIAIVVILAIVLGFIVFSNNSENSNDQNINNSENISDLELTGKDYSPSKIYDENNNKVELSDFADKPMAILFFNTSESTSVEALEILQKNYENYKDDVNIINIAVIDGITETKEDIKEYLQTKNIDMSVMYDTDYSAKNEYKVDKLPTFVFINKNNEIINTISEDINEDVIQANLDILAENY